MSPIWLPASLLGGLIQAWRTALQERLRAQHSVSGAVLVRYLFGLPFAVIFATLWLARNEASLPTLEADFLGYAVFGAVTQMAGTILLILSFGHRGFIVGTAFSKTEAIQVALVTAILFNERFAPLVWFGIVLGVTGILVLTLAGQGMGLRQGLASLRQPAALCGLGAGAMFAFAAIAVKLATAQVSGVGLIGSALTTLVVVMTMQSALHLAWCLMRDRRTLHDLRKSPGTSIQVGLLSAIGSGCWYVGFAAAPAALVRIVGQVEVFFTVGFARFYLRDPIRAPEVAGLALVALGVVFALWGAR